MLIRATKPKRKNNQDEDSAEIKGSQYSNLNTFALYRDWNFGMQTIVSESFYCRQARRYSRYEAAILTANRLGIDKKSVLNERFTCF